MVKLMQRVLLAASMLLIVGCVNEGGEGETENVDFSEDHDHGIEGFVGDDFVSEDGKTDTKISGTCSGRWTLPSSTERFGRQQNVPYAGAGRRCGSGPTSGARELADYIRQRFSSNINGNVPGRGVQIFNCRQVNGGSSLSLHSVGRALDIFIPTGRGGAADNAKGDAIANFLVQNAQHIGIQMVIWDRTIWTASRSPQARCYTGRHPHYDHLHVELSVAAGNGQTAFFRGVPLPNDDVEPLSDDFVGSPCMSGDDCDFSSNGQRGTCYLEHRPADGVGFCTLSCQGTCPDRSGFPETFCARHEDLGGSPGNGFCVQRTDAACDGPNMRVVRANRHVGSSGVGAQNTTVCAPEEPRQLPDGDNNDICEDRTLEPSDNGESCQGFGDDFWRCACSRSRGESISQVCRDGRWINFRVNPRDCAQCNGDFGPGCEAATGDEPPNNPEGNGGICADPDLPLSDHDQPCEGSLQEQWRCACSERLDSTIAQVCRGGRWINFSRNPRDCARCDGEFTDGCEGR